MFTKKGLLYITLTAMLLGAILIGGGCSFLGSEGLAAPVEELDERLVDANNGFGLNLFSELVGTEPAKNIFISPASVITALAMTYNGADGETKRSMEEVMLLKGMSMDEINAAFADLLTILQNPDPKVELTVANSLWAREGVAFNEDFLKRNEDYFGAEVAELNFDDNGAADTINDWVKEKTRNKIDGIVTPPINPETVLFLINAIYFKGEWSDPFDPEMTRDLTFNLTDGSQKDLPVMFKNDDFRYLETEDFQAVSLPYGKNERVSMYLFLPAANSSLEELYGEMNITSWNKWIASFGSMEGEVGLPRFKFEYEISLNDALKNLGMGIAFDNSAADFSGMRSIPPRLVISEVKHKTYVEVNEEGTEAAAVTSVEVGMTAMPETFSMIIDRPFFFAIADDLTGTILFIGSVTNP
jgi:serine protease inhibitor